MTKIQGYFEDYGDAHRTKGNKATHLVGIPLIIIAILGLLDRLAISPANFRGAHWSLAAALFVSVNLFYLSLHLGLGLAMVLVSSGFFLLGAALPLPALWAFFIVGWALQFAGHKIYEKKSPAFFHGLVHLLIGPLFILNSVTGIYKK